MDTSQSVEDLYTSIPEGQPSVSDQDFRLVVLPGNTVLTGLDYIQGYLKTQIGKKVRLEFVVGRRFKTDRQGVLLFVGYNYIVIKPEGTDDQMLCDIYSLRLLTILM